MKPPELRGLSGPVLFVASAHASNRANAPTAFGRTAVCRHADVAYAFAFAGGCLHGADFRQHATPPFWCVQDTSPSRGCPFVGCPREGCGRTRQDSNASFTEALCAVIAGAGANAPFAGCRRHAYQGPSGAGGRPP